MYVPRVHGTYCMNGGKNDFFGTPGCRQVVQKVERRWEFQTYYEVQSFKINVDEKMM